MFATWLFRFGPAPLIPSSVSAADWFEPITEMKFFNSGIS